MDDPTLALTGRPDEAVLPFGLALALTITDPESVCELRTHSEGQPRDEFALCALRIGLLALKQARGQLDGDTIRREGEKLLSTLDGRLQDHARGINDKLMHVLREYFDPESGRFHERVQRLVKKDGELEQLIQRQIGQQDSELCKTLHVHFGTESPLMKLLSPKESQGLLKALGDALHSALTEQRQRVLEQFSLDKPDGALSKLVKKLTDNHGDLNQGLQSKIEEVVQEFSLDKKDSALSRLVRRVTKAQKTISAEFSLDNDNSALSRMQKHLKTASDAIDQHLTLDKPDSALARLQRELLRVLNDHGKKNQDFQQEVKNALNEMKVGREVKQRTPLHGVEFEQVVHGRIQGMCQPAGHIVAFTGATVGSIKNCKTGDIVIELGPEHVAAGARIAVEAKDKEKYTLEKARAEIEQGRKNRGAAIGLFVFSRKTAPEGLQPFQRIGDDLFVLWDAEDADSDLYLDAALTVAHALSTRQARQRDANAADLVEMEKSILDVEKKAGSLDLIREAAESIKGKADDILNRVRLARKGIEDQVDKLREVMSDLKSTKEPRHG
jgi:hypothetical protein